MRPSDGRRVLKDGAVPTIFAHRSIPKARPPPLKRSCPSPPRAPQVCPSEHTYHSKDRELSPQACHPDQTYQSGQCVQATGSQGKRFC